MDYPKFYEIENELVVVTYEDDDLCGRVVPSGKQYPPLKAVNNGTELTRDEFMTKMKAVVPPALLEAMSKYF